MDNFIGLDKETIGATVPAALRKQFKKNEQREMGLSDRFNFYSTEQIIDDMANLGWQVVDANNARTHARNDHKKDITRHALRFRNPKYMGSDGVGSVFPEIILTSAHNGTAALKFNLGLYRKVCGNGMVVLDQHIESFKVRHHISFDFAVIRHHIEFLVGRIPLALKEVKKWSAIKLPRKVQLDFAVKALALRAGKEMGQFDRSIDFKALRENFKPSELLAVQRNEDEGDDLWHVFNRVQENLIRGNFRNHKAMDGHGNMAGKKARSMELFPEKPEENTKVHANIRRNLLINKQLWALAQSYAKSSAS